MAVPRWQRSSSAHACLLVSKCAVFRPQIDVVLGFHNGGDETLNVTNVMGSINSPASFNIYVQNFSAAVRAFLDQWLCISVAVLAPHHCLHGDVCQRGALMTRPHAVSLIHHETAVSEFMPATILAVRNPNVPKTLSDHNLALRGPQTWFRCAVVRRRGPAWR